MWKTVRDKIFERQTKSVNKCVSQIKLYKRDF